MTVIEMPVIAASRSDAAAALAHAQSLLGEDVVAHFPDGALSTPSAVGQLLRGVLVEGGAATLTLDGPTEYIAEVATEMANGNGLGDRLACINVVPT